MPADGGNEGLDLDVGITLNKLVRQVAAAEARMAKMAVKAEADFKRATDRAFDNLPASARRAAGQAEVALTAMQRRIAGATGLDRPFRSAEASARAFQDALGQRDGIARLEASLDPLIAAQQRLAAGVAQVDAAVEAGAISDAQAAQVKRLLTSQYELATNATRLNTAATQANAAAQARTFGVSRTGTFVLQNTAAQLGDMAVQWEAGTAASRIAGQQLPQLIGGFGMLGGALGVVAPLLSVVAAVGIPVAAMFLMMSGNADEAEDKVKGFADRLDEAQSALGRAEDAMLAASSGGLEDVRERFGEITREITQLMDELADIERRAAIIKVEAVIDEAMGERFDEMIGGIFGGVGQAIAGRTKEELEFAERELENFARDVEQRQQAGFFVSPQEIAQLRQMREEVAALSGDFANMGSLIDDLNIDPALLEEIVRIQRAIEQARDAGDFSAIASGFAEMRRALEATGRELNQIVLDDLVQGESMAREMAHRLGEAEENAGGVAVAAGGIAAPIDDAADAAARLSGNLATALDQLRRINSGISTANRRALAQARIRLDTVGQPVEREARLAREDFNEQTGAAAFELIRSGNAARLANLRQDADRVAGEAAVIARLEEQVDAAETAHRDSLKDGKGSGGSGGRPFSEIIDRQVQALERQIETIGKTRAEIAGMEAEWAMLDAARQAGLDLDARLAGSSETLREAIAAQAAQVRDLAEQYENLQARQAFLEDLADELSSGFADAFVDAIRGAESFADAFRNMAADILANLAKMIVQQTIYNALARALGLPVQSGGILGALGLSLPGRAAGGPVEAGQAYMVGERGRELFVPAVDGRIVSAPQTSGIMRGGAGGSGLAPSVRVEPKIAVHNHFGPADLARLIQDPEVIAVQNRIMSREGFRRDG